MKKAVSLFLTIAMVLGLCLWAFPSAALDAPISLSLSADGEGSAVATVKQSPSFIGGYHAYVSLYNGDTLLAANVVPSTKTSANLTYSVPKDAADLNVRAYVWMRDGSMVKIDRVGATVGKMLSVSITGAGGNEKFSENNPAGVNATYNAAYETGDVITITTSPKSYVMVTIDKTAGESMLYLPNGTWNFTIPDLTMTGGEGQTKQKPEMRFGYKYGTFRDASNDISVRFASQEEITSYRNLAYNIYDRNDPQNELAGEKGTNLDSPILDQIGAFPHAYANKTTNIANAMFYPRYAINNVYTKGAHGDYPAISWTPGLVDDAVYTLYFGREVNIDKIALFLRTDHHEKEGKIHDTYWDNIVLEFSDGSTQTINPNESADFQEFALTPVNTSYVRLTNLVPKELPNTLAWAALCELQVWGKDIVQ